MSSKGYIKLRTIARKIGVLKVISGMIAAFRNSDQYEEKFGKAMLSEVKNGDIVWDVGANLGLYTEKFLHSVGSQGKVVCFEPAPACYKELNDKFKDYKNVIINNVALGEKVYSGFIKLDTDPLAATHQLADDGQGDRGHEVSVVSGDYCVSQGEDLPNVIKIDVEGFELDVFKGLDSVLSSNNLRTIFCEIHFALLEERGLEMAPNDIETILLNKGFSVKWLDSSHIEAKRS